MASAFGWLDADGEHRRRMLEVIDLFREQGTIDELGFGTIRDTLADLLFPGTSTLHTRLRYVLFIPWLMQRAAVERHEPADMARTFTNHEYRLIDSLLAGEEYDGVFGNRAKHRLKRLPSEAYWGALGTWGIFTGRFSSDEYFRIQRDRLELAARVLSSGDPEVMTNATSTGIDPGLPRPPADLLKATTFDLTVDEEQYLSDRIAGGAPDTMLAWLVQNQPPQQVDFVWELGNLGEVPAHLLRIVDHARRFQEIAYAGVLVYNLMLARTASNEELMEKYAAAAGDWLIHAQPRELISTWELDDWWAMIRQRNPRLRPATEAFVRNWIDLLRSDPDLTQCPEAEALILSRERAIKGPRARLINHAALDAWTGASGVGRMNFRWQITQRLLADLYAARERST